MLRGYFITGTDTNAGKTWSTLALMRYLQKKGFRVAGMKPVASGCRLIDGRWRNDDALALQVQANVSVPYELVNPYAYELAISPHLAGRHDPVDPRRIVAAFETLQTSADVVLVEGAGGWYAPISDSMAISDLALLLALPVILVVAIRLGCINQARLTFEAIARIGLPCAGWIAACTDPNMQALDANIDTLNQTIETPLLGILPYLETADFDHLADCLSI